jgi:hypothetical protein
MIPLMPPPGATEEGLLRSAANLLSPGALLMVARSGSLKHTTPVAINAVSVTLNQKGLRNILRSKSDISSPLEYDHFTRLRGRGDFSASFF